MKDPKLLARGAAARAGLDTRTWNYLRQARGGAGTGRARAGVGYAVVVGDHGGRLAGRPSTTQGRR